MRTLYLIRHTAPAIAPGICYGQLDMDLADSFDEEAERVLNWLPPVQLILTSPLLRARRLATQLASAQHCELRCDARLMEMHFGVWEGRAWELIPRDEIDAWAADVPGYAPPGGESALQLMQRVQRFMLDTACLPQQRIALVAHGGSIRALLASLCDKPLTELLSWELAYGAVIGVRF